MYCFPGTSLTNVTYLTVSFLVTLPSLNMGDMTDERIVLSPCFETHNQDFSLKIKGYEQT